MRYIFIVLVIFFNGCDYGAFDKDKRQIMAKNYIEWHLPLHYSDFDITAFREDTVSNMIDSNYKHPISYTVDYHYIDSASQVQRKRTIVLFTPDGHSIITAMTPY